MGLFDFKHEDIEIKREHDIKLTTVKVLEPEKIDKEELEKEKENTKEIIDKLISKNEELTNILKNEIAHSTLGGINDFFDKTIIDDLDKFHNFMKQFMPGLPPYYKKEEDGSIEISLQAYIDARDYILNEFGFDEKNIVEEFDYNGNLNIEKMYFANDYSVSANGNIYHGNNMIFNSNDKDKIIVDYIDFPNGIIKFKPGVYIKIDKVLDKDKLIEELIINNPNVENKEPGKVSFDKNVKPEDIYEYDKEKPTIEDENKIDEIIEEIKKDVTLGDLEEIAPKDNPEDTLEEIKKIIKDIRNFPEGIQTCNTNKVNYLWLLFLIIIGGGSEKKAPFPQGGGVCDFYKKPQRKAIGLGGKSGTGASYSKPRNYRTGHNKLYSSKNRQGLKISLLQMLIRFFEPFFDINISILEFSIAGSHIKLLPAIDIGAFIEHCLLKFQEWISEEIRSMHGCDSQYIIPKIKETGEGLMIDGIEEINNEGRNKNDIEMYFRRNFAIIWNYTHYHSKYNNYTEDEKRDEMIKLYNTTKTSRIRAMSKWDIQDCYEKGFHIMFSDIALDYTTGKATNNLEHKYISRIQPGSSTKVFAAKTFENVDVNVDPSNVNKVIELGLFASYNCDMIDDLDFYEPDYSDSSFQPTFI